MTAKKKTQGIIEGFFSELGNDIAGQRVRKYIVDELESGRYLSDIIKDSYVRNRVSDERAKEIVANPDVIRAVEDSLKISLKGE